MPKSYVSFYRKLTTAQRKELRAIFEAETKKVADRPDIYDNDLGCGNCGDVGPTYKTLSRLKTALGLQEEKP